MQEIITETRDTSQMTPIEIALQMDENGMVSAKKLYEFLELNPSNYSRWCKESFLENEMWDENIDFTPLFVNDELKLKGNYAQDFLLTINMAENLAINSQSKKAKEVKNYFLTVHNYAKDLTKQFKSTNNELIALQNTVKLIQKEITDLRNSSAQRLECFEARMNSYDSGQVISTANARWINKQKERIMKLCKFRHLDFRQVCSDVEYMLFRDYKYVYDEYKKKFEKDYPGQKSYALNVCADMDLAREWYEDCLIKVAKDYGYYQGGEYVCFIEDVFDEDEEPQPFEGKYKNPEPEKIYEEVVTDPVELARIDELNRINDLLEEVQSRPPKKTGFQIMYENGEID